MKDKTKQAWKDLAVLESGVAQVLGRKKKQMVRLSFTLASVQLLPAMCSCNIEIKPKATYSSVIIEASSTGGTDPPPKGAA